MPCKQPLFAGFFAAFPVDKPVDTVENSPLSTASHNPENNGLCKLPNFVNDTGNRPVPFFVFL